MRLDAIVELVSAMDPGTFRDLAALALKAQGYVPAVTDGPYDGGRDIQLYLPSGQAVRILVQLSVERDWRKKLDEAAQLARDNHAAMLLFVSSRRIPEGSFQREKSEHLRETGVLVDRLDAQGIASLAIDPKRAFVSELLALMNLRAPTSPAAPFRREDLRERVAYACALFHDDAEDLRRSVMERAVCTALAEEGRVPREDVVRRVSLALGFGEHKHALIRGAIDRLQQKGAVLGTNGSVGLSPGARGQAQLERALRERQRDDLEQAVTERLAAELSDGALFDAKTAVLADLGALLLAAAEGIASEVDAQDRTGSLRSERVIELRSRVRRLTPLGGRVRPGRPAERRHAGALGDGGPNATQTSNTKPGGMAGPSRPA